MIMFELLSRARASLAEQRKEDQDERRYRNVADASANREH
jgi:hypothetical protein